MDSLIVPDESGVITSTIKRLVELKNLSLIITTGGTGFGVRDVTPEVSVDLVTQAPFHPYFLGRWSAATQTSPRLGSPSPFIFTKGPFVAARRRHLPTDSHHHPARQPKGGRRMSQCTPLWGSPGSCAELVTRRR